MQVTIRHENQDQRPPKCSHRPVFSIDNVRRSPPTPRIIISSMATSCSISSASSPFFNKKDAGVSAQPTFAITISKNKHASRKILSVMTPQTSERKPSTTRSLKTGMPMTEKIFSRASENSQLRPG